MGVKLLTTIIACRCANQAGYHGQGDRCTGGAGRAVGAAEAWVGCRRQSWPEGHQRQPVHGGALVQMLTAHVQPKDMTALTQMHINSPDNRADGCVPGRLLLD